MLILDSLKPLKMITDIFLQEQEANTMIVNDDDNDC